MAFNVTYQGEGYGTYDRYFKILIYQDTLPVKVETFEIDGCQIDYRPDAENFLPGIIPSECSFGFMVNGASDIAFISSLVNVSDKEVFIEVWNATTCDWRGWLMVDNIVLEDGVLPYTVKLTAVDGIADLKNTTWENIVSTPTIVGLLWDAIGKTGIQQLLADNDQILATSVDWYEDQMPGRSLANDPMNLTRFAGATYFERQIGEFGFGQYKTDENGDPIAFNYYDILSDVCRTFNARLYMAGGIWNFVNPFTAYTAPTAKVHRYTKVLAMTGALEDLTVAVNKSAYARDAGGTDTLLPQALSVTGRFLHFAGNRIVPVPNVITLGAAYPIGDLIAGAGNRVRFLYNQYFTLVHNSPTPASATYNITHKLTVQVGSYYLSGNNYSGLPPVWTLTPSSYFYRNVGVQILGLQQVILQNEISVWTPDIPADGTGTFEFDLHSITYTNGVDASSKFTPNSFYTIYGLSISMALNSETLEGISYESALSPANETTYTIDAGATYLGDGISQPFAGVLFVYTGSAWVQSTAKWRRRDTGTDYEIGLLRVMEIHALCFKSVYMMQGSIFGEYPGIDRLYDYISQDYVANLGTIDYDSQTLTGEWYLISDHSFTTIAGTKSGTSGDGISPGGQTEAFTPYQDMLMNNESAARLWGGVISDNGDGTIKIAAGEGQIKLDAAGLSDTPTAINQGQASYIQRVSWDEIASMELAGVGYNIIYWDYSAGAMAAVLKEDLYTVFDFTTDFTIGRIYYDGSEIIARLCGMNRWNFDRRVQMFGEERFPVERALGLLIGDGGGLNFSITSGVIWAELVNRFPVFEDGNFETAAGDMFTYWYRDGSGDWTKVIEQSTIDNINWDDGTGTLNDLTANRYGVHWVYVVHNSTVHVVYGRGDYTLAQAELAPVPPTLPGLLEAYATLVGKIIVRKSADVLTEVETPFGNTFATSTVTQHNDLSGIQGGAANDYYHLTSTELAISQKAVKALKISIIGL
jgi:hypothetical protein